MKKTATLNYFIAFFLLLSGVSLTSNGQATNAKDYYFYPKSGTYSYLSGGTTISAIQTDDVPSGSIPINFTFKYCGTDYTDIYASPNGWITFGSSASGTWPGSTSALAGLGKSVMALWDDPSGDGGNASYLTSGSSPNRVFTIECKNWLWDYSTSTPAISFQIKLYETSNIIQIIYKQESGTPAWDYSAGAMIGLGGGSSSDFLSLDGSGSSPSASSTVLTNTIKTKPASGQIYEFSPLPQCSGTPSVSTPTGPSTKVCPGVNFTLAENTSVLELGKTYQWKSRPASTGSFTNISGATSSTLVTSITENTDFQLVVTCSNSGVSTTSSTKTVNVLAKPAITASGPTTFCSNQLLTLSSASDASYTYKWVNVASGDIAGATTFKYDPLSSGKYTLRVSTTACTAGVTSADTIDVTVKPAPDAKINPSPSVTICTGENVTLKGSGSGNYQWYNAAGLISGATGIDYITGTAGSYKLIVINPSNACEDTSSITTVISTPAPTVSITPTDSANLCTGKPITINSSTTGSGLSYQWFNDATAVSGATTSILTTNAGGTYTLVVSAGSCYDTSNSFKVKLLPLPVPVITSVGSTKAVCPMGNDMKLEANAGVGYNYQWIFASVDIPGEINRTHPAYRPGSYVVRIIDGDGCIGYSDTFKVIPTPSSYPTVSPDDVEFCEGTKITLYSSSDKYSVKYHWLRNGVDLLTDTLLSYDADLDGAYSIAITDSFGCTTISDPANISVKPAPDQPIVKLTGSLLSTSVYATYQWFRNGKSIPGATARNYTIMYDGIYKVTVSNAGGCYISSDDFSVNGLGIDADKSNSAEVKLYPNPTNGRVTIEYPAAVNVSVKDLQGRVLLQQNNAKEIEVGNWADGVYFFTISTLDGQLIKTEKVVKTSH